MLKQYTNSSNTRTWLRLHSALIIISLIIPAGVQAASAGPVYPSYNAADSATAETGAFTDGVTVQGVYGNKSAMQQNAINPFVGTNQNLHTIDGTKSSSVTLPTASSNAFVTLYSLAPNANGDITNIYVSQDLLDGSAPITMQNPAPPFGVVSGVCANGVISCTPGTFSGCTYYLWDAPGGKIQLTPATLADMAGCYGINNASGSSPAILNLDAIVSDLGAGAVASVLKYNPYYTISGTNVAAGKIAYFGRITTTTSDAAGLAPVPYPVETPLAQKPSTWDSGVALDNPTPSGGSTSLYTSNTSTLSTDSTAALQNQATDKNSYYSIISNSLSATQSMNHPVQCTMNNVVTIVTQQNYCDEPAPTTMLRESEFTQYFYVYTGDVVTGGWSQSYRPIPPTYPVGFDLSLVLAPQSVTAADILALPHTFIYPSTGGTVLEGQHDSFACDHYGVWPFGGDRTCYHSDTNQYYEQCTRTYDNQTVQQVNSSPSCAGLDVTAGCVLTDETVDSVVTIESTVHKFSPTGGCYKSVTSQSGLSYKIPLPWCQKTRIYSCPNTAPQFDLSGTARMDSASGAGLSTSGNNYQMAYPDKSQNPDGSWTSTPQTAILSTVKPTTSCEQMCKISRPSVNTQIGASGPANATVNNAASTDIVYNVCSPTCATQPGDTILQDCGCLDTFSDAIVAIGILQQAKTDVTCSATP
jgi:hypothetical protein